MQVCKCRIGFGSKALVGEGEREWQARAAAANDRYVEAHRAQVSCYGRCGVNTTSASPTARLSTT